jgi:FeS assembly protein IscX
LECYNRTCLLSPILRELSANAMTLTWETSYAIALALKQGHPDVNIEEVTLQQIYAWTLYLPGFEDDPSLCNDEILSSIYQEWYEELINA